jgi:uncharacterized lipoprotein YajG
MKLFISILFTLFCTSLFSQSTKICIGDVVNSVKIGPLTGNKNLAFGIKNIAEEALLDKGYELVNKNDSTLKLNIEVIYLDIQQTSTGVSVFHKNDNETIIRMKGVVTKEGKKIKDYIATGKSSEISTSIVIVDEGGGFNQASARSALKKTIINLIEKLL